ncbi:DUF7310 family coiled-coil domain-containing protein [Natronorubrum texcoconense]|uniref:DUF7310 domain-containing protein n=1 Tax=Natronorubrum texcoconense TaxID=1095776 RepID=A0A1G9BQ32_9EURY|nr:hypothetical protein [Natronorubrum texcoconense]SDK41370.1 hypothetical protein SAMN04515672_3040 [Natronorubrum texcoconense]
MSDIERIDQRLSAVERAVVDGDVELDRLADLAAVIEDVERLETRLEEHERRLAELEGNVDAVTGLVGNVETVNEGVERQADAAIAAVDRLEYRIDELERSLAKRERQADGRDFGGTSDRAGTEPSALETAGGDEQAARSGHASGTGANESGSMGLVAAERSTADASLGESSDVEATAETLLEPPEDEVEADDADGASSSGLAVQEAIERRLSGSDDADDGSSSIGTSSSVGASNSDSAASADDTQLAQLSDKEDDEGDGNDESSSLFASLRATLS